MSDLLTWHTDSSRGLARIPFPPPLTVDLVMECCDHFCSAFDAKPHFMACNPIDWIDLVSDYVEKLKPVTASGAGLIARQAIGATRLLGMTVQDSTAIRSGLLVLRYWQPGMSQPASDAVLLDNFCGRMGVDCKGSCEVCLRDIAGRLRADAVDGG